MGAVRAFVGWCKAADVPSPVAYERRSSHLGSYTFVLTYRGPESVVLAAEMFRDWWNFCPDKFGNNSGWWWFGVRFWSNRRPVYMCPRAGSPHGAAPGAPAPAASAGSLTPPSPGWFSWPSSTGEVGESSCVPGTSVGDAASARSRTSFGGNGGGPQELSGPSRFFSLVESHGFGGHSRNDPSCLIAQAQ